MGLRRTRLSGGRGSRYATSSSCTEVERLIKCPSQSGIEIFLRIGREGRADVVGKTNGKAKAKTKARPSAAKRRAAKRALEQERVGHADETETEEMMMNA